MSEFTTVFLFTDIIDYQIREANWTILIISVPIVCVFLVLLLKSFPKPPGLIKEKAYITITSLSTPSVRGALLIIALVWLIVMGMINQGRPPLDSGLDPTVRPWAPGSQAYAELQKIYNSHQYFVAEGLVHVIHAQRYEGHDQSDIITVGNTRFEISYYTFTFGYTQTISHGGVLTEGTYARVFYIENSTPWERYTTILRVDVKNQ